MNLPTITKYAMRLIWPLAIHSQEDKFTVLHVPSAWSTEAQLGSRYMLGIQRQIAGLGRHKLPNKITFAIGEESENLTIWLRAQVQDYQYYYIADWMHSVVNKVLIPYFGQVHGEWLIKTWAPAMHKGGGILGRKAIVY